MSGAWAILLALCAQDGEIRIASSTSPVVLPEKERSAILVSAGGALAACRKARPDRAAALLEALSYRAVNIGAEDLELGADAVRGVNAPLVSANLFLAGTQDRPAKPWVVVAASGVKVGITGVTVAPREAVAGLDVRDPAETLKEVIPALEKECGIIVLLAWMDRSAAAELVRPFRSIRFCIHAGRGILDPEPLKVGETLLAAVPAGTIAFTDLRQGRHRIENAPTEIDPKLAALLRECLAWDFLKGRQADVPDVGGDELPKRLEPGRVERLRRSASNRAVRLHVHSVSLRSEFGGVKAPEGRALLTIDAEWENILPLALVYEKRIPVEYRVSGLENHLYLVVNGRRLSRLHSKSASEVRLDRLGARLRAPLLFEIPAAALEAMELRFYDDAHGHVSMPLLAGSAAPPKPITPLVKNDATEVGVYGLRRDRTGAPEGMTYLIVELLARSCFAVPGDDVQIGALADWPEARKDIHLTLDGEYGYAPRPESAFPARLLPNVPTGGELVFLIPEKATSVELRCDIPNLRTPGGEVIHPEPLVLELEGKRPELQEREAIASIDDDTFQVTVVGQSVAREFAGTKAGEKKKFLVLDVSVACGEERGDFFRPKEQLLYGTEKGRELGLHQTTFRSPRYPSELVWIPSGERRTFQVVFEIPETERRLRLAYRGVSKAETVDLKGD